MRKYTIILEPGPNNWCIFSPDVPGCVSTGDTAEEALSNFHEALEAHLELMLEDGDPIPPERASYTEADYAEIDPNDHHLHIPWAPAPQTADSLPVAPATQRPDNL